MEGDPGDIGYDGKLHTFILIWKQKSKENILNNYSPGIIIIGPPGRIGDLGDYGELGAIGEKGQRVCIFLFPFDVPTDQIFFDWLKRYSSSSSLRI